MEYLKDLAKVPRTADTRMVVIGPAKPKHIAGLRKETGYTGEIFVDPTRALYAHLGLVCNYNTGKGQTSEHVHVGTAKGFVLWLV